MADAARDVRTTGRPPPALVIYLRDHEAAAVAGNDLFARMARAQTDRTWGPTLAAVAAEVADDLTALQGLLRDRGVRRDRIAGLALRAGERIGRLKLNGRLVRRAPLSDLLKVEAGLDAVHAKACGWHALRAAYGSTLPIDVVGLARRADDQLERMRAVHATVAAVVL